MTVMKIYISTGKVQAEADPNALYVLNLVIDKIERMRFHKTTRHSGHLNGVWNENQKKLICHHHICELLLNC